MSQLICERCDIPVGFTARGVVEKPEGRDEKWLDEHCWGCGRSEANIEAVQHSEPAEAKPVGTRVKVIELYACPTVGCISVTSVRPGEKLEESWTGPKTEDRGALEAATGSRYKHNRAECPDCRQRGERVQRVRVSASIRVPVKGPPTPPLPGTGSAPVSTQS